MRMTAAVFPVVTVVFWQSPTLAQNPCAEIGPDCRVMNATEIKALKERLLAIKALLPVPAPARYAHDGAAEGSTMPFVAEAGIPGAAPTCRSWPAGCFTTQNTLYFSYFSHADRDRLSQRPKDILSATETVAAALGNRVEIAVWVRPHPHLVDNEGGKCVDVSEPDAVNIEKSATFLAWESGEDVVNLHMVFGPRTCNEPETLNVERPAKALAPIKSLELQISGPKAEVAALKKRIDRRAFEALLGAVVK